MPTARRPAARPYLACWAALAAAWLTAPAARGQVVATWTGATGNWSNPALWSTNPNFPNNGTPPGTTYAATVNGAGALTLDQAITLDGLTFQAGTLSGPNTLTVNGPMTWAGGSIGSTGIVGTIVANGPASLTGANGTMTMAGGQLTLNGGATWSGGGMSMQASSITIPAGATFAITGNNALQTGTSLGGSINNAGVLRKQGGTGTTTLGSQTTLNNSGTLEVLSGTLALPHGIQDSLFGLANTGTATVGPGATLSGRLTNLSGGLLQGTGTISGTAPEQLDCRSGSTLAPGPGPGILTSTGAVSMSAGSHFAVELNGNAPGTGYDRLSLGTTGTIFLGSTLDVSLGYAPAAGDALAIILGSGTGTQVTGTFANAPTGSTIPVGSFGGQNYGARITYTPRAVTLDNFQVLPVPEPGSLGLAAAAATAGVGVWVRGRRKSRANDFAMTNAE
jgi:fibronectin-binding autotransporter adhesin